MLFGSTILEVAIGMVFVYLLLSLLCSAISEYVEAKLNYRAKDLQKGIRMLLNDPEGTGLADRIYKHPLVKGLYRGERHLPSYIPSRNFALALWSMATSAAGGGDSAAGVTTQLSTIRKTVAEKIPDAEIRTALLTLIDEAGGDLDRARQNIEDWYDSAMDRVSGWYKRRVHVFLLIIGIAVSAAINADTINIGQALVKNDVLRKAVVAESEKTAAQPAPTPTAIESPAEVGQRVQDLSKQLSGIGLPIGWTRTANTEDPRRLPDSVSGWILKVIGLLLTGLAVSQGAPFWFDLLNKFMVVRSTVKPREKSREQPSKDKPAPKTEVEHTDDEEPKD